MIFKFKVNCLKITSFILLLAKLLEIFLLQYSYNIIDVDIRKKTNFVNHILFDTESMRKGYPR